MWTCYYWLSMLKYSSKSRLSEDMKLKGGKGMKKKIFNVGVIMLIATVLFGLTGCGISKENKEDPSDKKENKEETVTSNNVSVIDDNKNYFITIKGEKFNVGDKIADVSKVGLKLSSKVLEEKISKNTYMIGAGYIYNENDKEVCNMTPYNPTGDTVTVADSVIGAVEVGDYQYDEISQDILDLDIEVCGGIKLGSSYDDVKKIFGETDDVYESESLGYKKYSYKSEEVYRYYEFTVDKDGKVSKIYWKNLVYND